MYALYCMTDSLFLHFPFQKPSFKAGVMSTLRVQLAFVT